MVDIKIIDYEEPVGWFKINLEDKNSDSKTINFVIQFLISI